MGNEPMRPKLEELKNRACEDLVKKRLHPNEKILYIGANMPREMPTKSGILSTSNVYFTNFGRVICFQGGGWLGEDKCAISYRIDFFIDNFITDNMANRVRIKTTGYPEIDCSIPIEDFLLYSKRSKAKLNINYNNYVIIENKVIGKLKISDSNILLTYYTGSEFHKKLVVNKVEYSYIKEIKYNEAENELVMEGIFKELFCSFPKSLTLKNISGSDYENLLYQYDNYIDSGKVVRNMELSNRYVNLKMRFLQGTDVKTIFEGEMIANVVKRKIRIIDTKTYDILFNINIDESIFVKYNKDSYCIYTNNYYIAIENNITYPISWNYGQAFGTKTESAIEYLLADFKKEEYNSHDEDFKSLINGVISNPVALFNPGKAIMKNIFKSTLEYTIQYNYKRYEIEELSHDLRKKIGTIILNERYYPIKLNFSHRDELAIKFSSEKLRVLDIDKDINKIELVGIDNSLYCIKIFTEMHNCININCFPEVYYNLYTLYANKSTYFSNLNEAYFNWGQSLRDTVIFYYFALSSELKGYLDNIVSNNGEISEINKEDKIKIINVMYDTLKQYKNSLMEFSAYFSKELYEEHAKDSNIAFKHNFDSLQQNMLYVSNQIIRHINDCIQSLNNLICYIYPELDIRNEMERLNNSGSLFRVFGYGAAAIITGSLTFLFSASLNAKGIFDSLDRSKLTDDMEEAKINIFLQNTINEFNNLMVKLMPRYIEDINNMTLTFIKSLTSFYNDDDTEFLRQCVVNNKIFLNTPINPAVIKSKKELVDFIIGKASAHKTSYLQSGAKTIRKLTRSEYHKELQGGNENEI